MSAVATPAGDQCSSSTWLRVTAEITRVNYGSFELNDDFEAFEEFAIWQLRLVTDYLFEGGGFFLEEGGSAGGMPSKTAPGDFDVYLLAQTWAPSFCCERTDRCSTVPWAFSAKHLSLHGLWPGFVSPRNGDTYPASCATKRQLLSSQLPREYIDLAPAFTRWNPVEHRAEVRKEIAAQGCLLL